MTRAWGDGGRSCPGRPVRVSVVRESVEARRRPCVAGREADRAGVSRGHGIGRSRYSLPGRGERQEWSARGSARTSRSDRRHPANAGLPGGADGEPVGAHSRAQRPIGARRGRCPPRAARTALGGVSLGHQPVRGVKLRPGRPRRPGTHGMTTEEPARGLPPTGPRSTGLWTRTPAGHRRCAGSRSPRARRRRAAPGGAHRAGLAYRGGPSHRSPCRSSPRPSTPPHAASAPAAPPARRSGRREATWSRATGRSSTSSASSTASVTRCSWRAWRAGSRTDGSCGSSGSTSRPASWWRGRGRRPGRGRRRAPALATALPHHPRGPRLRARGTRSPLRALRRRRAHLRAQTAGRGAGHGGRRRLRGRTSPPARERQEILRAPGEQCHAAALRVLLRAPGPGRRARRPQGRQAAQGTQARAGRSQSARPCSPPGCDCSLALRTRRRARAPRAPRGPGSRSPPRGRAAASCAARRDRGPRPRNCRPSRLPRSRDGW